MSRKHAVLAASLMAVVALSNLAAQSNEKQAVEAVVRSYEDACQAFDHDKAVTLLAPGAKWIEHSTAVPADDWTGWWTDAKGKVRIEYHLRDFETHVHGDVAWVTLNIDGTFTALNDAARALNHNEQVSKATFVESEVLVKTAGGWRIALGHTSEIPGKDATH
jgi:ketosteroid isomerase-like protein